MTAWTVLWVGSRRPRPDELTLLSAAGAKVTVVLTFSEAISTMAQAGVGVVVLSTSTDESDIASKVRSLKTHATDTPVVVLVPTGEDIASALGAGAHDALAWSKSADEISARVLFWVRAAAQRCFQEAALADIASRTRALEEKVSLLARENEHLRDLAHQDELTSLSNRRGFFTHLARAVDFGRRYGGAVSVLVCDLDGMKRLNDTCGHPAGDAALRQVASILKESLRGADLAARLGGDEFAVIMPATGGRAAARVAERIRGRVCQILLPSGIHASASFGIATQDSPSIDVSAESLFARADAVLYAAKRLGKNRVEVERIRDVHAA
ncbi:MAG: diguanylate cyclase [Deltaproteobacteria bacterium]|nr:diguanylate cyclase [Deltaproteobacteria bacterium]